MSQDDRPAPPALIESAPAEQARRAANKIFPFSTAGRFQPGVSGNPAGQSHFYHQCRKIARQAGPEMMDGLIDLAKNAVDERVRSVCLNSVLDRAGVRPVDYDPSDDPEVRTKLDVTKLTPEERQNLRELLAKMTPQRAEEPEDGGYP